MKQQDRMVKSAAGLGNWGYQDGGGLPYGTASQPDKAPASCAGVATLLKKFARSTSVTSKAWYSTIQYPQSHTQLQKADGAENSYTQQQSKLENEMEVSSVEGTAQSLTPMPRCSTEEPTIKVVFLAVTKSNTTLTVLAVHVGKIQADISFIRNNLQNVREQLSSAAKELATWRI